MGLLRRHDLFLDLSQPIFAKEDLSLRSLAASCRKCLPNFGNC
jgi:hypothetical protein